MLHSLQVASTFKVDLGDKLPLPSWFSHKRGAPGLQRMATQVFTAEAGDGAAVPPWGGPPLAPGLCIQPACSVAPALPSHLHQALHCPPEPTGSLR